MYIDSTGTERTLCGRYKITECEDLGEISAELTDVLALFWQDLLGSVKKWPARECAQ